MSLRYCAAGFRTDQEQLIKWFTSPEIDGSGQPSSEISLRFSRFCEIWRQMNFSLIFRFRQNEKDLREFVDEIYLEVLQNVCSEHPFGRRVSALYLLYALYVKQPIISQKIRLNFQYLEQIRDLIQKSKELEQMDVCFVWYKLLSLGAIDLVHVSRLMGPYYIRNSRVTNEGITETDLIIDDFKTSIYPPMNELSHIHEKYRTIKDLLVTQSPELGTECNKIEDNVFELCKKKSENLHKEFFSNDLSHQSMATGFESQESEDSDEKQMNSDIGTKRRRLREKASTFGTHVRQQVMEEISDKQLAQKKPIRGRPKLAKLSDP